MLKVIRIVLIIVLVASAVFFFAVYLYLAQNGQRIAIEELTKVFKRPVTVARVSYYFPRTIVLYDLEVEGLLWVVEARLKPALSNLWRHGFVLANVALESPTLALHRTKAGTIVFWEPERIPEPATSTDASLNVGPPLFKDMRVVVRELHVQNGRMYFPDHYSTNPVELAVANIQLDAENVPLTLHPAKTNFDLFGTIVAGHLPFLGDQIQARGWLNWQKRDMEARVSVLDSKSKLSFWAVLNSVDNNCQVRGNIQLNEQARVREVPRPEIETADDLVMGILETTGIGIDLDFDFTTQMDSWRISQSDINFKGNLTRLKPESPDQDKQVMDDLKNIGKQLEVLGGQSTNSIRP